MDLNQPSNVVRTISDDDAMWKGHRDEDAYFTAGWTAARAVAAGAALADLSPQKILDFGSGHGRVLRWFRAVYPEADLFAMDRVKGGIEFCAEAFGAHPRLSSDDFANLEFDGPFDLIWLGSVYTHLNLQSWQDLTRKLTGTLRPGGCLAFSFAGPFVAGHFEKGLRNRFAEVDEGDGAAMIEDYRKGGFGYARHAGNSREWGRALISHGRLFDFMHGEGLSIKLLGERLYDNWQDIVVAVKS